MIPMSSVPVPATDVVGARQVSEKRATARPRKPRKARRSTLDRDRENRRRCRGSAGCSRGRRETGLTIGFPGVWRRPPRGRTLLGPPFSCYNADWRRSARIRQWRFRWVSSARKSAASLSLARIRERARFSSNGLTRTFASGGNLFRTELYFVSTREFPNLPFGGAIDNVVDPQTNFGVGLRVFGEYSLKVVEPQSLIVNLVGTQNLSTNDEITDWMREQLLKTLRTDVVAHVVANGWPLLGIAAHTDEIESETIAQVQRNISSYGLQIVRLGNFTITLKPEDEDKLKNFLKDVQYTKLAGGFQQYASGAAMIGAGQGLAQGPGQGGGVNPAFLGVGLGVGGVVAGQLGQTVAAGGQIQVRCPNCHALNAESAKFCNSCGQALSPAPAPTGATVACPKCGTQNAANGKFCTNCGQSLTGGGAPEKS